MVEFSVGCFFYIIASMILFMGFVTVYFLRKDSQCNLVRFP